MILLTFLYYLSMNTSGCQLLADLAMQYLLYICIWLGSSLRKRKQWILKYFSNVFSAPHKNSCPDWNSTPCCEGLSSYKSATLTGCPLSIFMPLYEVVSQYMISTGFSQILDIYKYKQCANNQSHHQNEKHCFHCCKVSVNECDFPMINQHNAVGKVSYNIFNSFLFGPSALCLFSDLFNICDSLFDWRDFVYCLSSINNLNSVGFNIPK